MRKVVVKLSVYDCLAVGRRVVTCNLTPIIGQIYFLLHCITYWFVGVPNIQCLDITLSLVQIPRMFFPSLRYIFVSSNLV
jgi:hypothetical protein